MSVDGVGPGATFEHTRSGPSIPDPPVRWCRRAGLTHRVLADEVLLLGPTRELVTLTGLSAPVFLVLDQPASTAEVSERINRRWPSRPAGEAEVDAAIALLVDGGILAEFESGAARVWGVADGGAVVEVAVARPLLPELARRWPIVGMRATAERPEGPVEGRVGLGRTGLFVPDDLTELSDEPQESAWGLLEQSLTAVAVAQLEHLVAVHAAVIAHDGVALLVPAASGSGKSTLTEAAARAGATVLSDEYALVDPGTGLVTGWPRPVRMRQPDGSEARLDLAESSPPMPVGLVASVTYQPDLGNAWEPVGASEAVMDLLANVIVARTRPDASLDAALAVTRGARAVKGARGEADEAIAALLALMERPDGGLSG